MSIAGAKMFPNVPIFSKRPPGFNIDPAAAEISTPDEEKRKKLAAGRGLTNFTGGLGDTSKPNLAAKSLLGA